MDEKTTIASLKESILKFAHERDWEQFHSPKNLSMALAAEAGELMEHFLWVDSKASLSLLDDSDRRQQVEEEIADVIIYALEFANICGLDVSEVVQRKMQINEAKYPVEKAKGNSKKYTDL